MEETYSWINQTKFASNLGNEFLRFESDTAWEILKGKNEETLSSQWVVYIWTRIDGRKQYYGFLVSP